jgi:hypothetical protein
MSLDTVSLSDVGQSLVAIEAEIKSNQESIAYHRNIINEFQDKNEALAGVARSLLLNSCPRLVAIGSRSPL